MGSHCGSNPRPPTIAVDALTTDLRLPRSSPAHVGLYITVETGAIVRCILKFFKMGTATLRNAFFFMKLKAENGVLIVVLDPVLASEHSEG